MYFFYISLFLCSISLAGDSLLQALITSETGARLQAIRLRVVSENLANADSIGLNKKKEPYRRRIVIAKNIRDSKTGAKIVKYVVTRDKKTPFFKKYDPNHPMADKNGYVMLPNVVKDIERADAMEANVSYEANLKLMKLSGDMIKNTIDLLK